jgi:hypothetical protein
MLDGHLEVVRIHRPDPNALADILTRQRTSELILEFVQHVTRKNSEWAATLHPQSFSEIFFVGAGLLGLEEAAMSAGRYVGEQLIAENS